VAALPGLAGLSGVDRDDAAAFTDGFHTALTITGGLAVVAGVVAFVGLTGRPEAVHEECPPVTHCPLEAPALR
jgi:hypothetical protein